MDFFYGFYLDFCWIFVAFFKCFEILGLLEIFEFIKLFNYFNFLDFLNFFQRCKVARLLIQVTEVSTEHQKLPKRS